MLSQSEVHLFALFTFIVQVDKLQRHVKDMEMQQHGVIDEYEQHVLHLKEEVLLTLMSSNIIFGIFPSCLFKDLQLVGLVDCKLYLSLNTC